MTLSIHLIAVGKNKDKALQSLIDDYAKRLPWKMTCIELTPPTCTDAERKSREAILIRAALPSKSFLIALDERGEAFDSPTFAKTIGQLQLQGHSSLTFLIGGADGLDDSLRQEAALKVCFGRMTWPHMLVRLLLAEQLYRASTILNGHPYHRI